MHAVDMFEGLNDPSLGDLGTTLEQTIAVNTIRVLTGWHIAPVRQDTRVAWLDNGRRIDLRSLRVKSVESVTLKDGTTIDPADCQVKEHGILILPSCVSGPVTVEFTHGVDEEEIYPLVGVVQSMISRAQGNPNGVKRLRTGGREVEYFDTDVTIAEQRVLAKYRLAPIP